MITVIIPNWNGKKFLPLCLDSLRDQAFRDFETILVDNGSEDGSCDFVRESYPEVKVISLPENRGFSGAVNAGIKEAGGKYIALLNNDTEADAHWLEELCREMDSDENIGICASKIVFYFQKEILDTAGVIIYDDGVTENRGNLDRDGERYQQREFIFGACAAAALYRKKMLDDIAIGGEVFDEDFLVYYEDSDVNMRSQLMGYKCLYVPSAVVYHIGSATAKRVKIKGGKPCLDDISSFTPPPVGGDSRSQEEPIYMGSYTFYHMARNYWNFIIKNMPLRFFWKRLWKTLFYEFILYFLYSIKRGIFFMYLSAKWKTLCQLPVMLEKRRMIQARRKVKGEYIDSLFIPRTWKYYKELFGRFFRNIHRRP
jgi:GT2 family glycosyltransferase